jgi:hypothetical protein
MIAASEQINRFAFRAPSGQELTLQEDGLKLNDQP